MLNFAGNQDKQYHLKCMKILFLDMNMTAILESRKHSLINELRWSAAAIGRLCPVKNFFVYVKDPIDSCVRLSFSSFW